MEITNFKRASLLIGFDTLSNIYKIKAFFSAKVSLSEVNFTQTPHINYIKKVQHKSYKNTIKYNVKSC